MELTNFEIYNIMSILERLAQNNVQGVRVKYRIGKIVKDLNTHYEDYVKARQGIIDECAEKDEDGEFKKAIDKEGVEIPDRIVLKDSDDYNEKMKELSTDKVKVTMSTSLDIGDLEKASVDLSIQELMVLQPILTEDA